MSEKGGDLNDVKVSHWEVNATMKPNQSVIIANYNSSSNCYHHFFFCSFMLHTDTRAFKHLSHFSLIYSKWIHDYVKICWKCARNHQAGLWDFVTCTSLWTSQWSVAKLTFRGTCGCWCWCCWCSITRGPIYICRMNSELSETPIFDSITKSCNNICLGCGGVELQC